MNSIRLSVMAMCVAAPAFAQEMPQATAPGMAQPGASGYAMPPQRQFQPGAPIMPNFPGGLPPGAQAPQMPGIPAELAMPQAQSPPPTRPMIEETITAPAVPPPGTVPNYMPPKVPLLAPDRKMTRKEAVGVSIAQRWIGQMQTPHLDHLGVLHFREGEGQVLIVAAANHTTDVRLEPGEQIMLPLSPGDKEEWHIHPLMGIEDGKRVAHITIKPENSGLSSNLVIHTSKRTLSIELASRQKDYMPLVAIDAADDDQPTQLAPSGVQQVALMTVSQGMQTSCDLAPSAHLRIRGDAAQWRPVDAYWVATPVGTKTCVRFQDNIDSVELPILLQLGDDGGWFSEPTKKVVNLRYINKTYMVDEALARFVLISGVGGNQQRITIDRPQ